MMLCSGPQGGETKRYRCQCCGLESDNIDDFAMTYCWGCTYQVNENCDCYDPDMDFKGEGE